MRVSFRLFPLKQGLHTCNIHARLRGAGTHLAPEGISQRPRRFSPTRRLESNPLPYSIHLHNTGGRTMGNICGKAASPDVSSAGRRLGSAPATQAATSTYGGAINVKPSAIPLKAQGKNPKVVGPGKTLGGPVSGNEGDGGVADAREAAAIAAEVCLTAYHRKLNLQLNKILYRFVSRLLKLLQRKAPSAQSWKRRNGRQAPSGSLPNVRIGGPQLTKRYHGIEDFWVSEVKVSSKSSSIKGICKNHTRISFLRCTSIREEGEV